MHRLYVWILLVWAATMASGCGPSAAAQAALSSLPSSFQSGGELVLYAPPDTTCEATYADTRAELKKGGVPWHQRPMPQQQIRVRVLRPQVTGSTLLLHVEQGPQSRFYLQLPAGKHTRCVYTDTTAIMAALEQVGRQVAFTPWKETCGELAVVGEAAASVVMDTDPVMTFEVTALRFGPSNPADYSAKTDNGGSLWFELGDGLTVRGDTLERCFTEGTSEPPSLAALIATPTERCVADEADADHLTCRTSLGIWEGEASANHVALRRVRRTLGTVHFHGGQPVSGAPYARTIIALESRAADPDLSAKLLDKIHSKAKSAVDEAADESVRIVDVGDAAATHEIVVAVEARVDQVKRHTVAQTSRYKSGEKTVTNPDKEPARQRLEDARRAVKDAQRDYDQDVEDFEEAKQKAMDECREQQAKAKDKGQNLALGAVCDLGSVAMNLAKPSRDALNAAQEELRAAEKHERNTPETIQEDIMDDWRYDKTVFGRSAAGTVRVALKSKRGANPVEVEIPIRYDWEDYQVTPDPKHNVEGHEPAREYMDSPEPLLSQLAQRVAGPLGSRVQAAVTHASLEEAKLAAKAAGQESDKPGFEIVDAVAFQIAGARIKDALFRGETSATKAAPALLPSTQARMAPDECVLAVATVAAEDAGELGLELETEGASHADERGRPVATVELCGYEVAKSPPLRARVKAKTQVKWGLYLTKGGEAAGLAVSPATAEPEPVAVSSSPSSEAPAAPELPSEPETEREAPAKANAAAAETTATPSSSRRGGAGESCRVTTDCQSGLSCTRGVCHGSRPEPSPPSSSRLGGVGESCRARADCQAGLRCMRNTCTH